jgi:hypothetical protein
MTRDEQAIGAVVDEIYAMISGPAGPRDWSRQDRIFHDQSRQMRTWIGDDGRPAFKIMGRNDYATDTSAYFETHDFFEIEVGRTIKVFGNIAHVWSIYEARPSPDGPLDRRGINSIQLFFDGDEWRIVSMIWDNERPGVVAAL